MTVDDLFPEDEGGDDHPIMGLFFAASEDQLPEEIRQFLDMTKDMTIEFHHADQT